MIRIGQGFDVHRVEAGDGMTLGGLWVPCAHRVVAHSDGDFMRDLAFAASVWHIEKGASVANAVFEIGGSQPFHRAAHGEHDVA